MQFLRSLDCSLPRISMVLLLGILGLPLPAQYFTTRFDDVQALWGNGWAQQNRSTTLGSAPDWFQGDPGVFPSHEGGDTAYIAANYHSLGGSGTISNWLFAPTCTFHNGEKISFWTRTVAHPNYPDRLQLRLSLNGASTDVGTTPSSVGDFTTLLLQVNPLLTRSGYPSEWTRYTVTLTGLPGPTSGRFAFRYFVGNGGPSGINSEYIGIDSVAYFLPPAGDLQMLSIVPMEYTLLPERHPFPGPFTGRINNYGSTPVSNATLQVRIQDGQGSQVYTATSLPLPTLQPGDTAVVTVPAPSSLPTGSYTLQYTAQHPGTDGDPGNDTLYDHFQVTPLLYARDNGTVVGSIGIGAYVGGYVGQQFHLTQPDNLDSIWVHVTQGYTGRRIGAVVWDMDAGLPHHIIGTTDTLTYTTDSAATYVLPLHPGRLQLPPGDVVVTFIEFDSTLHIGLASGVFTPGTTWLSWPTLPIGDWANVEFFGLPAYSHAQMIRLLLSTCDMTIATSATPASSPGSQDGTATVVATGGTPPYTYLWSTGATTATITGLGTSPVSVTVTDASGCESTATQSLLVGTAEGVPPLQYRVYPNPNDGRFTLHCQSPTETTLSVSILDAMGRLLDVQHPAPALVFDQVIDLRSHPPGWYWLRCEANGLHKVIRVAVVR